MQTSAVQDLIIDKLTEIIRQRGLDDGTPLAVTAETELLGGIVPIDSLDLATLIVELEAHTGKDPFRGGFVDFRTVGELALLYAD